MRSFYFSSLQFTLDNKHAALGFMRQRGPERPREAQRGPERPREAQRGPERPREAHKAPETPREAGTSPEASKGALVARGPKMQFKQLILICFYIKKIRPPKPNSGGRPDRVPGEAQRGRCRWATCTVRWVGATLVLSLSYHYRWASCTE